MKANLINKISYLLIIALALNYGCAARRVQIIKEASRPSDSYLIQNVPFYKQTPNTCGPAALASILEYWNVDFEPADLLQTVYSPSLPGSLDFELSYYARKFDLWSKYYQANFPDLKEKIKQGIPLIVIQKESPQPKNYHYIVVFGFDDQEEKIIAHIGRKPNVRISYDKFLKNWEKADFGTLLICLPEKVTWTLDPPGLIYLGYLLEKRGLLDKACDIYLKAISLEPESKIAYFNLGNVYFKMNEFKRAEEAFKAAIELDANFADAYNNLACVYLSENRNLGYAEFLVQKALELNPLEEYYLDTLNQIKQRSQK